MIVGDFARQDEPFAEAVYRWLATEVLTEERTDDLIDVVNQWMPFPDMTYSWLLDWLLPEKLLALIAFVFQRFGWLPSDRALHRQNPFPNNPLNRPGRSP